jgi:hypothetical protein
MIAIKGIKFGNKQVTQVNLIWGEVEFSADGFVIKAEFCDAETNCLYRDEKGISKTDYYALGTTKEIRTDKVLELFGLEKAPVSSMI